MRTISDAIEPLATRFHDKIAFVHRGLRRREMTYAEAYDRIRELGGALQKRLEPKSKVLIYLPNSPDYACMLFACAYTGMIAVPADLASGSEFAHRIARSIGVDLIVSSVRMPLEGSVFIEDLEPAPVLRYRALPDDIFEIVSTSGTTGDPKGVVLTHRNIVANVESFCDVIDASHRTYLSFLPLSHMLEQTLGLFIPLIFGSKVVYVDSRRPSMIRSAFRSERISTVVAVPIILESFLESTARIPGFVLRMKGLREFIVGGAPLSETIVNAWERKGIDVYVGYGLTETAPIVSCQRPGDAQRGTVGRPLPGVEVRIVDDEIQVRGDNVTVGYYLNERATNDAFDGEWFRTGDRGKIQDGCLIVTGRKKNLIILKNGMNVYPEDIERVLDEHVDESVVVDRDDTLVGVALGSFDPESVRRAVNAQLPVHMRLARLIPWEGDLPRTRTMKIKRDEVRSLITSGAHTSGDRLTAVLARFSPVVSEESTLGDMGIDSLDRMMLTARLEEEFSVQIDPSAVTAQCTVAELREVIKRKPPRFGLFPKPFLVTRMLRTPLAVLLRLFGVRFESQTPPDVEGPVLLVSNHESHLDSFAIHRAFRSPLSIAAAADYFYRDHRTLGRFASWTLSTYPFEREGNPLSSFERSGAIMDAGHSILVYPEGTRSTKLAPFKSGVGLLARELACPVIPVHVSGGDRILGKGSSRIKAGTLSVRFGEPFTPLPTDDPEMIARRMHDAVKRAGARSPHT